MPKMSPEREAAYALDFNLSRSDLSMASQLAYDRMKAERAAGLPGAPLDEDGPPARSSPEVRERILEMFKRANPKYAKPFEQDRLAAFSIVGTESWAEYGQVVLQLAILDTLLPIEEKLSAPPDPTEKT